MLETELFIGMAQLALPAAFGEYPDTVFWQVVESKREVGFDCDEPH
jgi:hypothetical protein